MSNAEPAIEQPKGSRTGGSRVLVTGGAGYIGSVAAEQLANEGHQVVVLDNLIKGHRGAIDPRAVFVEGDYADSALVEETFRKHRIESVLPVAAHTLGWESVVGPGT
jgi:UDP-glucose 4-epimerase